MAQAQSPAARRLLATRPAPQHSRGRGHVRGPGTATSDSIDAKLSDGEFVLPADTVRRVGAKKLRDLVAATHEPSGNPPRRGHFADGGMPGDEENKRPNSFGDAAAAANSPDVTLVGGGGPAPVAGPPPAPAATVANIPQPAQQQVPAGANSFGDASAVARDPSVAQVPTGSQDARTRLLGPSAIPTDGPKAPVADGSQDRWANTELGRNLAALPGVAGALPAVVKTGGAISTGVNAASRLLNAGMGIAFAGPAPASATAPSNPFTPSAQAGAGRGVINPPAVDPAKALPALGEAGASQSEPRAIGDRTTLTNEQAATMNPGGRVTVTRNANGTTEFSGGNVSGQVSYNDPGGKALPGGGLSGKGFSGFDVAPAGANVAMGPNGSYAFSSDGAQQPSSGGQRSPVGMSVEEAQRQGLVGERVGYNPAYDQRLTAAGGRAGASAQNMAAADNLAANQEQGARGRLMAAGAPDPSAGGVPQVQAPIIRHSGNDWQSRNDLRNLEVSASSITNRPGWDGAGMGRYARQPGTPSAVAAYQAGLKADLALRQAQPGMGKAAMQENAGLLRTGMQEEGGTARARLLEAGRNDRFGQEQGLARDRFGQEQTAAGYQNRSAQRIEKAQQDLEAAGDDPVKLGAARQRLLGLQGKTDDARWKGIALQGATDAMGNKTEGVLAAVNERTGDIRQMDRRPAQSTAPVDGTRVRGKDGLIYVVRNGKPVLER